VGQTIVFCGLPAALAASRHVNTGPAWYNWTVVTGIDIRPIPPPLQFDAHGVCRVGSTRVTLLSLIDAFEEGAGAEEIYQEYPSVSLADVYAVIAFYLDRREEVDAYLKIVRQQEEQVIERIKSRSTLAEIRRRLLARKPLPT
jgi:uncharacterized protein (DUF433 family)